MRTMFDGNDDYLYDLEEDPYDTLDTLDYLACDLMDIVIRKRTGVTCSTKTKIIAHLNNCSVVVSWFEARQNWIGVARGLVWKAQEEQEKSASLQAMDDQFDDQSDDSSSKEIVYDSECYYKPYESAVQRSNRTIMAFYKRDDLRGKAIKRDKFALWASREKPTRRKLIKLARRKPDESIQLE